VILYRILTGEELLLGAALLLEYPLWVGTLTSMGRRGVRTPHDIEERSLLVCEALSDGYLDHRLKHPDIEPKESLLFKRLFTLEVKSYDELVALL
jgi:hypothetical protein